MTLSERKKQKRSKLEMRRATDGRGLGSNPSRLIMQSMVSAIAPTAALVS